MDQHDFDTTSRPKAMQAAEHETNNWRYMYMAYIWLQRQTNYFRLNCIA